MPDKAQGNGGSKPDGTPCPSMWAEYFSKLTQSSLVCTRGKCGGTDLCRERGKGGSQPSCRDLIGKMDPRTRLCYAPSQCSSVDGSCQPPQTIRDAPEGGGDPPCAKPMVSWVENQACSGSYNLGIESGPFEGLELGRCEGGNVKAASLTAGVGGFFWCGGADACDPSQPGAACTDAQKFSTTDVVDAGCSLAFGRNDARLALAANVGGEPGDKYMSAFIGAGFMWEAVAAGLPALVQGGDRFSARREVPFSSAPTQRPPALPALPALPSPVPALPSPVPALLPPRLAGRSGGGRVARPAASPLSRPPSAGCEPARPAPVPVRGGRSQPPDRPAASPSTAPM